MCFNGIFRSVTRYLFFFRLEGSLIQRLVIIGKVILKL